MLDKLNCDKKTGNIIRQIRESKNMKQSEVIMFMQLNGLQMTKSAYSKIEASK